MRLIDADALLERESANPFFVGQRNGKSLLSACKTYLNVVVSGSPTIDAVPVVRCKDCEHWNKDALACDTLPWVDSSEHANWYADDFCSYGERKDGGKDG